MDNKLQRVRRILILSLIGFLSIICQAYTSEKPIKKVVEVVEASLGTIMQTVRLTGVIKADKEIHLTAKESGIIEKIYIKPGSYVKKGQLIATLKSYSLASEKERIAKKQLERIEKLHGLNISNKVALDKAKKEWIDEKQELEKTFFQAPFDGIIGVFKLKEVEEIKSGQILVTIYSKDNLYVNFDIPEYLLKKINNGQRVIIKDKITNINEIQHIIDPESHTAPARAMLDCADCIIGSFIDLDLIVDEHSNAIIIPYEAIFLAQMHPSVYIVEEGKIVEKKLKTGIREKENIEVVEGVKIGDKVVIRGQSRLSPGEEVSIFKETNVE